MCLQVVLGTSQWAQRVPHLIEAFFFKGGFADEENARKIHAGFMENYPHSDVPLLRLNLNDLEFPFTYADR